MVRLMPIIQTSILVTTLFAYMMTGTKDLEPWIRFQLNTHSKQSALIKETHQPKVETEQNLRQQVMLLVGS